MKIQRMQIQRTHTKLKSPPQIETTIPLQQAGKDGMKIPMQEKITHTKLKSPPQIATTIPLQRSG